VLVEVYWCVWCADVDPVTAMASVLIHPNTRYVSQYTCVKADREMRSGVTAFCPEDSLSTTALCVDVATQLDCRK
jgi:hypothetical protein